MLPQRALLLRPTMTDTPNRPTDVFRAVLNNDALTFTLVDSMVGARA